MESERDWQELRRKLEPLQTRLNETDNPTHLLQDAREPYGSILFEALLGHETDWEPILRNLFHQQAPLTRSQISAWMRFAAETLGNVSRDYLFEFFVQGYSSCDAGIQEEISWRLIAKTGGRFEEITRLMQEAENGSWYDLLARLQRKQSSPNWVNEICGSSPRRDNIVVSS